MEKSFDQYAEKYDSWFLDNKNVLYSEVKLAAYFLRKGEKILSIGCGSGLFEKILKEEHDITITEGVEPSKDMANIAIKRGINVTVSSAEEFTAPENCFDTILYNGCPCYINNLHQALENSYKALKKGGKIILIDVPKESSYGLLYNLAKSTSSWNHELLKEVYPRNPYPIELVNQANWRTTKEKIEAIENAGFKDLKYAQTLTRHPLYSNEEIEEPSVGYQSGDYVAVCAYKR